LKGKDQEERDENKDRIQCQENGKGGFSSLPFKEVPRVIQQASGDKKEKERAEKDISRRLGEIPERNETCGRRGKERERLNFSQVAQRKENEPEPG